MLTDDNKLVVPECEDENVTDALDAATNTVTVTGAPSAAVVREALYDLSGHEPGGSGDGGARIGMTEEWMERARSLVQRIASEDGPLGPSAKFEHDIVSKNGQAIPCETHVAVSPFDEGFRGTAEITRDISDRKRLSRHLEVTNRLLGHGLQNDPTTVIEHAELAEIEAESASVAGHVQRIRETAFALVATSDEIRWVQEPVDTRVQDTSTVDLTEIVAAVVDDLREQYPEATVETALDEVVSVRGNESLRIALANLNLVENAMNTPKTTGRVSRITSAQSSPARRR